MATIFQNTDINAVGNAVTSGTAPALVDGDSFVLARDTTIVSTGGSGIFAANTDDILDYNVRVDGQIYADANGISFAEFSSGVVVHYGVTIGSEGVVSAAREFGVRLSHSGANPDSVINLTNHGEISAQNRAGAFIFGAEETDVINTGSLICYDNDFSEAQGLYVRAESGTLINSGLIRGSAGDASALPGSYSSIAAVTIRASDEGDSYTINNSGTISAPLIGVYMSSSMAYLSNSGLIQGQVYFNATDYPGTETEEVHNSGTIIGDLTSNAGSAETTVYNSGTIQGDVDLGAAGDLFDGTGGTVTGIVGGGAGDDTFYIDQNRAQVDGGANTDTVYLRNDLRQVTDVELIELQGGGGHTVLDDDTATRINGNTGDNVLMGAGGNDTIRGGQGLDELSGGDGDDLLIGNSGDDEIDGGNGADQIFGGRGHDAILGGFGQDTIAGGAGDDTISGGGAKDILSGGYGADVFLFESATEAGSGAQADRIDNFARGEDLIDIQALGATPASFIGTAAFSGGGNMEVRYTVNPFGNALVRIDEDGNGTEDARIVVSQTAMLDAGDFLL